MSEMKNYAMDLEAAVLSAIEEDGAETLEDVISEVRLQYVFVDEEYVADLYWAYTESYNSKYYA
jgi:hypothetical protein|tara:strand:+ start:301 stop:492 length:192 start_codon:yes stop_codon:yes gene_type:complete